MKIDYKSVIIYPNLITVNISTGMRNQILALDRSWYWPNKSINGAFHGL